MATKIGIKPIVIPRGLFLNPQQLRTVIRNTVEDKAKDIKIDFEVTAQTWNNKPKFTIGRNGANGRIFYRVVGTDSDIYKFVSGGTKIRYAIMTPNFKAKTRVNVIGSGPGRGGFSRFSRKKPKPGIKARNFDKIIAKKWDRLLPQVFERAIAAAIS